MSKTIKEWLEMIPDEDARKEAFRMTSQPVRESKALDFGDALASAFVWRDSEMGHEYWSSLSRNIQTK